MKKRTSVFFIILVIMLALGGCKDSAQPDNSNTLPQTSAPSETPPSPASFEYAETTLENFHVALATNELLNKYDSFHEYINDEDGARLIIWTDTAVKDFAFITVDHDDTGDKLSFLAGDTLFSIDELSPEKPFVVKLLIPGSMPAYGISFVDENGVDKLFSINLSGRGIEEAPPYYLLDESGNGENDIDDAITKTAWQYIVYQIDNSGDSEQINGSEITRLELVDTYQPTSGKSVNIYSLEYSFFLNKEDGWVSGSTDLGNPYLFIVNKDGSPQILGVEYSKDVLAGGYKKTAEKVITNNEVLNFAKQSSSAEPFSEKEITAAMDVVKTNYAGNSQLLINLWYDPQKYQTDVEEYKGNTLYGMSEAAERGDLLTLYSDIYFPAPSGSSDGLMRGWKIVLIRDDKDAAWKIIDQGY